jgi:transcription-repair coupling factor (superfamily II helicase)
LVQNSGQWRPLKEALLARQSGGIDGAWGSSAALAVAALAGTVAATVLVVVPNLTDVAPWAEDLTTFHGVRPQVFPAFETWPVVEKAGRLTGETGQRLRVLQGQSPPPAGGALILAPMAAVMQPVPPREDLSRRGRKLVAGQTLDPDEFAKWLHGAGYKRVDAVEAAGEFGKRGGIVDFFPPDLTDPVRLEFFGDDLESIRVFTVVSQRSLEKKAELLVLAIDSSADGRPPTGSSWGFVLDYFPPDTVVALVEPNDLKEQGKYFLDRVADPTGLFTVHGAFAQLLHRRTVTVSALPRPSVEATAHLRVESVERFSGDVKRVRDELDAIARTDRVLIACQSEAEVLRLTEVLKAGQLAESDRLRIALGHVRAGFRLVAGEGEAPAEPKIRKPGSAGASPSQERMSIVVIGSHQLFHKELTTAAGVKTGPAAGGRKIESRAIDSFLDLNDGDFVVHIAHGIARFRGMRMLEKGKQTDLKMPGEEDDRTEAAEEEFLMLEFRDAVFLYVPATRIDLVQRYVGGGKSDPSLSKLGGTSWGRKKGQVAEAVMDAAADMIRIQAVRAGLPGHPFPPDSDWQTEFEAAFPYQETPDQVTAIAEMKGDLERPKPMDRLLCGDVGYGKTEVAIRAVFKAIDNGKQVAVLVPTTVLAEQHYRTFKERLAEYPFTVECLSRYKSAKKQKEVIKHLAEGGVDVVVGTHRLISDSVKFKDLGLVIIDEEQRFGVEHKEKLKRLRTSVHILTMSATPIPRTLHSALLGVREISNLETPPLGRFPVETRIIRWDEQLIRHAIHREFNRGGQVYFVHNKVYDIKDIAAKLQHIVPDAKIVIGHGQMADGELEAAMLKFVRKEADILVATTIIESGLDIPSANTMFIDEADIYGLADLHQLRGRVGRTNLRAYAYLIVDPLKLVSPTAQQRLKAIEEFTDLGAGFKIAMRDLEIRGAGNILGTEQSGHIAAVGYEMYCQLLENAVRQLKKQSPRVAVEVNVNLPWPAFLPRDYVPGQKLRIEVYRRLSRLRDPDKLTDFRQELRDRYGPPPEPVEWLLRTTQVRLMCVKWQVSGVHRDGRNLVLTYKHPGRAAQLVGRSSRLKIIDDKHIYLKLSDTEDDPAELYPLLVGVLSTK